jgi:prolyl-tRNA synthetase
MKDLYTFDSSKDAALETYEKVRDAYDSLFSNLGIPFLTAEADSGNMGGKLSHEYHFESPSGEDTVWTCNKCKYTANDEVVETGASTSTTAPLPAVKRWRGISKDRSTEIVVVYAAYNDAVAPRLADLNVRVLKEIFPELDTSIDGDTAGSKHQPQLATFIVDQRLSDNEFLAYVESTPLDSPNVLRPKVPITTIQPNDPCPRCPTGHLTPHRTIEVGHTFHLGTRYSAPLNVVFKSATVGAPPVQVEMGCHGIGVSRLIGAMANVLATPTGHSSPAVGLRWPLLVAPFHIVVIADDKYSHEAQDVYDLLSKSSTADQNDRVPLGAIAPDILLDDREKPLGWRLKDADLIGYPVVVILGKQLKDKGFVEVQCRKTGEKKSVPMEDLRSTAWRMLGD